MNNAQGKVISKELKRLRDRARAEGWTKQRLMTERGKIIKEARG